MSKTPPTLLEGLAILALMTVLLFAWWALALGPAHVTGTASAAGGLRVVLALVGTPVVLAVSVRAVRGPGGP